MLETKKEEPAIGASENIHYVHNHDIDFLNNEIYLVGVPDYQTGVGVDDSGEPGVEHIMASRFIKNLNLLSNQNDDPITIHMKTCGGDWSEGIAIYDAIRTCKNHITIVSYTHARSMSSLIFLAADHRIMHQHSTYMFHGGMIWTGGTQKQFETMYEENKKSMDQMINIYVDHLKKYSMKSKSKKAIREWIIEQMKEKEDVFFSAEESLKLGFTDEIV
jgi:ATP-dependent protease ClpP protease subunit